MKLSLLLAAAASTANAYWLMGIENFITTERLDPLVSPGKVSSHVHSVLGGSNFRFNTNTSFLRQSECTSVPIPQDKSAYWFPHLYFQWNNGSFSSLNGGAVICKPPLYALFFLYSNDMCQDYLFNDKPGTTRAFPDDFRMMSGDPTLRTYDPKSYAQQAVTFLCLDFTGVTTKWNSLPSGRCPSGIRAQINFPSCWDGKNTDSPDHKSHVAYLSGGPDSGTCSDPRYPVTLPRIFMELYWNTADFEKFRSQAKDTSQPFVYAHGDPTGYGYHADFINGWDAGVLQRAVDNCHCNIYGDPTCCAQQGIFNLNSGKPCRITPSIQEQTTGTIPKLPGNNPVQPEGKTATIFPETYIPALIGPVYAYTGQTPTKTGSVIQPSKLLEAAQPIAESPAPVLSSILSSILAPPPPSPTRPATTSSAVAAIPSSFSSSVQSLPPYAYPTLSFSNGVTHSSSPVALPTIVAPAPAPPGVYPGKPPGAAAPGHGYVPIFGRAATGKNNSSVKRRAQGRLSRHKRRHF